MKISQILLITIISSMPHFVSTCCSWQPRETEPQATPIHEQLQLAITTADNSRAQQLITDFPRLIGQDDTEGNNPLMQAIKCKNLVMTRYCLQHTKDTNKKNNDGYAAIHLAAQADFYRAALLLKDRKANLDNRTDTHKTWLDIVQQTHPDKVERYARLHNADDKTFDRMYIGAFGCYCCCEACSCRCDACCCDCCLN